MSARILIADDYPIYRAGLRALIAQEADLQVVGEASDSEEALLLAEVLHPDVVIMDIGTPSFDGVAAALRLSELCPEASVLALAASEEASLVRTALQAGVFGFVPKGVAEAELIDAIRAVIRGDVYVHSHVSHRIPSDVAVPVTAPSQPQATLTPRERDVLRLIALGYTNPEIADGLRIGVRTVETHRENLSGKLHAHTRSELVRYALGQGLLGA